MATPERSDLQRSGSGDAVNYFKHPLNRDRQDEGKRFWELGFGQKNATYLKRNVFGVLGLGETTSPTVEV